MKKKPIKKKLFFLNVPIYEREICVIVGMTHEEVIASAKKQKCTKSFMKALDDDQVKEFCESICEKDGVLGAAYRINDQKFFLFVRPHSNDWEYLDILNHECFHLTQFMGHRLKLWDDVEAPAYLHQWLFKKLRRTLAGLE